VVVVVEAMRLDDLVADARVGAERWGHDGPLTVGAPSLVEHVSHGFGAEGATLVGVADRRVEGVRAVEVEQTQEPRGRAPEVSAMQGDLAEEGLGCGTDGKEAVASAMLCRLSLVGGELLTISRIRRNSIVPSWGGRMGSASGDGLSPHAVRRLFFLRAVDGVESGSVRGRCRQESPSMSRT
jgi:hypothetical protein